VLPKLSVQICGLIVILNENCNCNNACWFIVWDEFLIKWSEYGCKTIQQFIWTSDLKCHGRYIQKRHKLVLYAWGVHSIVKLNTMCKKKNPLFLSCITKMGQNFINFFSWVDIHGIYYILKNGNQIWWSFFLIKHTISN